MILDPVVQPVSKAAPCFLNRVLEPPSYGFERDGKFYAPTNAEIIREFLSKLNLFRTRKNWLPVFSWVATLSLAIPLGLFFFRYFSWPLLFAGFVYSMILLGSHGTFWLHRYCTHRAFRFRSPFWASVCRNLVIRIIPEEVYVVSHHVHHRYSEQAGDPYNVNGGWLYCFLADVNHQGLNRNLSEKEYDQVAKLLGTTGVRANSYSQYLKWGSLSNPYWSVAHYAANWSAWYGIFYLLGGHALACALFGASAVWGVGVRTYNFEGHGKGKDRRKDGSDFNREDWSVNQIWPGYVAGEWHNNHHLYPNGARSGFLNYQIDLPWYFIAGLYKLGIVTSYRDYHAQFMRDYYLAYRESRTSGEFPVLN